MKKIFVIDWTLLPAFILTAFSGIRLHVAGHGRCHEVWHNWAVFHVVTSLAFLILVIVHAKMHWSWYKGILPKRLGKKSLITFLLSILFLFVTLTGIVLLMKEGGNSCIGMWHYRIGLLMIVFAVIHIIKRWSVLKKSLKIR